MIAVVAANDPFVMSGWARVEGLKDKVANQVLLSNVSLLTAIILDSRSFRHICYLVTIFQPNTLVRRSDSSWIGCSHRTLRPHR